MIPSRQRKPHSSAGLYGPYSATRVSRMSSLPRSVTTTVILSSVSGSRMVTIYPTDRHSDSSTMKTALVGAGPSFDSCAARAQTCRLPPCG